MKRYGAKGRLQKDFCYLRGKDLIFDIWVTFEFSQADHNRASSKCAWTNECGSALHQGTDTNGYPPDVIWVQHG